MPGFLALCAVPVMVVGRSLAACVRKTAAGLLACFGVAVANAGETVTYETLAPILEQRCIVCHTGDTAPAGLRLDRYESVLEGSTRGAVVKAGDPAGSELLRRLRGESLPRMPMTGPPFLPDAQIAAFERWIAAGLPRGHPAPSRPASNSDAPAASDEAITWAQVAPIFARRCAKCHTDEGLMGPAPETYRLDSYEATLSHGERARIVPGNAPASELLRRIRGQALPRMPFDGPPWLKESEIALIEQWIVQGTRASDGRVAPMPIGARVRLHGRLQADGTLDGLVLSAKGDARVRDEPRTGDYVEVRGRVQKDGEIRIERMRRR